MRAKGPNKVKRIILIAICLLAFVIFGNGIYWVFSNIQQSCYSKVQKANYSKGALNCYEKCSMYTINLAICVFGYPFSREATIQQIYTLFPTSKVHEWHSRGLFMDKKTLALMAHYPNASKSHPVYLNYGDYSIKNIGEIRCALAANGGKIKKEGYFYVHKCH